MSEKILDEAITIKKYISEKEYKEISKLEEICSSQDKTNLKLELDYRMNVRRNPEIGLKEINELLYYVQDTLVAYISISSFGGSNVGEVNGMTHPNFRRRGLFKRLFELAMEECKKRKFNKVLLLSDGNSRSGIEFINSVSGEYDFSEYRMKVINKTTLDSISPVRLRKAEKQDGKQIARQNAIFFDHSEEYEWSSEEDEDLSKNTYMVELDEAIIGKIAISYDDDSAFISGFGILPDFRGKGYGKASLKEALRLIDEKGTHNIELDVESKNSNALNLYKACGFKEQSVMSYYKYNL
jgi:ribosomal protein S18 acetylase RimI-like enzyme